MQKGTLHSSLQLPVSLLNLYPLWQEVQIDGVEQLWQKGSRHMGVQLPPVWLSWYSLMHETHVVASVQNKQFGILQIEVEHTVPPRDGL